MQPTVPGRHPGATDGVLAVNAWQGRNWGGYSNASYGACLPNKIVSTTVGRGTWGPDYQGQHW